MIDVPLVQKLIAAQFPKWKDLPIKPVENGGWDNRTFRLGEGMLVRLPSAAAYASQVEKEHKWLPQLAPKLPLAIPEPLALGHPTQEYPWNWSIYRWIEGTPVNSPSDTIASTLADFLKALHKIDIAGGPTAGPHSFYRGGSLQTYDAETRKAIEILKGKIDASKALALWEAALKTGWNHAPVWVHGDISASNLLTQKGPLIAVIDFGQLTLGDPACDLAIAWTFFKGESRVVFQNCLQLDEDTWLRGKAWALWKALIIAANLTKAKPIDPFETLHELIGFNSLF